MSRLTSAGQSSLHLYNGGAVFERCTVSGVPFVFIKLLKTHPPVYVILFGTHLAPESVENRGKKLEHSADVVAWNRDGLWHGTLGGDLRKIRDPPPPLHRSDPAVNGHNILLHISGCYLRPTGGHSINV